MTKSGTIALMDWGDVPTWIGSISTALALVAAGLAARAAFRLLKVENARDAVTARRAESAQAEKVAAWVTRAEDGEGIAVAMRARTGRAMSLEWRVLVANRSDLPIYDVELTSCTPNGLIAGQSDPLGLLPPGDSTHALPDRDGLEAATDSVTDDALRIQIHFRDAAGFGWTRCSDGSLKPDLPFDDPLRATGETPDNPLEDDHGEGSRSLVRRLVDLWPRRQTGR